MSDKTTPPAKAQPKASERIEQAATRVKQSTSAAVDQTHEALDRAADKVESSVHHGTDKAAHAAEQAVDGAAAAARQSREAMDEVMAHAGDWVDKAREYVREKPTQSVLMAVAAGWLVGRLMRR